jgi:hypothetical protein
MLLGFVCYKNRILLSLAQYKLGYGGVN